MIQGLRAVPSVVTSIARVVVPIVAITAPLPGSFSSVISSIVPRVRAVFSVSAGSPISGTTRSISRSFPWSIMVTTAMVVPLVLVSRSWVIIIILRVKIPRSVL